MNKYMVSTAVKDNFISNAVSSVDFTKSELGRKTFCVSHCVQMAMKNDPTQPCNAIIIDGFTCYAGSIDPVIIATTPGPEMMYHMF